MIDYDTKSIKNLFLNGMNISALTSEYCDDAEEQLSQIGIGEITPDMQDVFDHFENINRTLKDKMYAQNAEELFKCIPMKMEMFYTKFEKYMEIPIFKYYDAYQVFQRISCANNEDIVSIRECLMKRAKKYTKELQPEIENLTKLKNIIDTYLAGKDIGIKIVMLQEFSNDLETILKIYNNEPTIEGMQSHSISQT